MPKKPDLKRRIIDRTLELAAVRGWQPIALADIAAATELSLVDLYAQFPSKTAILEAFSREVDQQVLAGTATDAVEESTRDRLFDVLMRRFDALEPHRAGIQAIFDDAGRDPVALACGAGQFLRSMALMAEAAGLSTSGLSGLVRVKGLALLYLATLRVWLRDDTQDKSKTMAALDARLRRAESWVGRLRRRPRPAAA